MTSRDFCFWLQGFFELQAAANNHEPLNAQQIGMVKAHLALVFKHEIDPAMGDKGKQKELDSIHAAPFAVQNSDIMYRC